MYFLTKDLMGSDNGLNNGRKSNKLLVLSIKGLRFHQLAKH